MVVVVEGGDKCGELVCLASRPWSFYTAKSLHPLSLLSAAGTQRSDAALLGMRFRRTLGRPSMTMWTIVEGRETGRSLNAIKHPHLHFPYSTEARQRQALRPFPRSPAAQPSDVFRDSSRGIDAVTLRGVPTNRREDRRSLHGQSLVCPLDFTLPSLDALDRCS